MAELTLSAAAWAAFSALFRQNTREMLDVLGEARKPTPAARELLDAGLIEAPAIRDPESEALFFFTPTEAGRRAQDLGVVAQAIGLGFASHCKCASPDRQGGPVPPLRSAGSDICQRCGQLIEADAPTTDAPALQRGRFPSHLKASGQPALRVYADKLENLGTLLSVLQVADDPRVRATIDELAIIAWHVHDIARHEEKLQRASDKAHGERFVQAFTIGEGEDEQLCALDAAGNIWKRDDDGGWWYRTAMRRRQGPHPGDVNPEAEIVEAFDTLRRCAQVAANEGEEEQTSPVALVRVARALGLPAERAALWGGGK